MVIYLRRDGRHIISPLARDYTEKHYPSTVTMTMTSSIVSYICIIENIKLVIVMCMNLTGTETRWVSIDIVRWSKAHQWPYKPRPLPRTNQKYHFALGLGSRFSCCIISQLVQVSGHPKTNEHGPSRARCLENPRSFCETRARSLGIHAVTLQLAKTG